MTIDFYFSPVSPPSRLVQLVAAALDLELNFKPVNVQAGEHLKPEFVKINPLQTIPAIVDNGFSVWESRAISRYLIAKYGKNGFLNPKDLKTRALVDQRLDFDLGTLYARFADYFWPQLLGGQPADEGRYKKLEDALNILNTLLEGQTFAVGSELTLADLAFAASVSTIDAAGISLKSYPNITKWFTLIKSQAPKYEEANGKGAEMLRSYVAQFKANKS